MLKGKVTAVQGSCRYSFGFIYHFFAADICRYPFPITVSLASQALIRG